MEAFKDGKVQKDNKLWFYFNDFFMEMSRKDTVNLVELGRNI
jgi:hypothetical protein